MQFTKKKIPRERQPADTELLNDYKKAEKNLKKYLHMSGMELLTKQDRIWFHNTYRRFDWDKSINKPSIEKMLIVINKEREFTKIMKELCKS